MMQKKFNYLIVVAVIMLLLLPASYIKAQTPAPPLTTKDVYPWEAQLETDGAEVDDTPVTSYFTPPPNALLVDTRVKDPDRMPGNIRYKGLHIHPYVSVKEEYTDNVFLRKGLDDKSDFMNTSSPGLLLLFPFGQNIFQLDYRADLISYSKYTRFNTQDQMLNGLLNFNLADQINIKVGNDFVLSSTPPRGAEDMRNDFSLNNSFFESSYRFADRFMVTGFYSYEIKQFSPGSQTPQYDNYKKNDVRMTLFYKLFPLTSILAEYGYTHKNNARINTDSDTQIVWTGIKWEPSERIAGTIKGGYLKRDVDSPNPNRNTIGFRGDVKYRVRPTTIFSFYGFREPVDTSYALKTSPYGTFYITTGGTLSAIHMFTREISISGDVTYTNDDYQQFGTVNQRREDTRWKLGVGMGYQPRDWINLGLKYTNLNNSSNIDTESYNENRMMLYLTANF